MTKAEVLDKLTDRQALVATLWGEVRGGSLLEKVATANAIANRVRADLGADGKPDWWGEGFKAVCLKPWQYSCWWETGKNFEATFKTAEDLVSGADRPDLAELGWIADGVLAGAVKDLTGGATHYVTKALLSSPMAPKWAAGREPSALIGKTAFFAKVEK